MKPLTRISSGADFSLGLAVTEGDHTLIVGVRAALKRMRASTELPRVSDPEVALFSWAARSDTGMGDPGIMLTLTATQTAALTPGLYAVDARLTLGSGVVYTSPVVLEILSPVTGAA